ncbi:6434_t:CDS:2 [Cetraspora pellucida]|uniref:6434_t:CDS:1 n=1 Tax=Cetraspora pellucida TaxID=1433469 RepID=A0A9N9NS04_9GLOM|nr:6434_t:CDS:2 [Cetraspora pellucida]
MTKSELHEMVKFTIIDDYIDNCLNNYIVDEEVNRNNNTYEEDLSSLLQTNLILEDVTSVEENVNMNFNSENLVDSVLNVNFD